MKNPQVLLIVLALLALSCEKETQRDYRDEVVGSYGGIRVHSYWAGDSTAWVFHEDSSATAAQITKSGADSAVVLTFSPAFYTYTFNYRPNREIFIQHGTSIFLGHDSLYLYSKPNLGPDWNEFYLLKSN